MRLQLLSPGSTTWNEDQSRKNFEAVRQKVVPGNPVASPLLIHPLRYEAGGDQWHGGGAQFTSANEPEWQTIAAWVQGKNAVSEATLTGTRASSLTATGNPVAGVRTRRPALWLTLGASVALLLAFPVVFFALVAPANEAFLTAAPAAIPGNWMELRASWETGHAIRFVLQLAALSLLTLAILFETGDNPRS